MLNKVVVLVAFLVNFAFSHENIEQAFKNNQVTPDVISSSPTNVLSVKYTNSGKEVELGNELAPKDVREIPEVKFDGDAGNYYTLILTDPDAPSRKNPVRREWLHWLVVNIPGNDISKGETINEYVGSGPPKDTDLHRYVFLVYEQPKKLTFDEARHSKTDGNRGNFSAEKFAGKYKMGRPVSGNFFQAQFDDSVPELHKQLGFGKK